MHPDSRKRPAFAWYDALILIGLVVFVAFVLYRADTVLKYHWNWTLIPQFILRWDPKQQEWVSNLLLQGFFNTIRLAIWSALLALPIGILFGFLGASRGLFGRLAAKSYVALVRNTPALVLLFILFFFVSGQVTPYLGLDKLARTISPESRWIVELLFTRVSLLPSFASGVICLALFEAAYVAEIVRAGILGVEKGQWEAARAVGLRPMRAMRLVILPQALSKMTPPLASQFISLVKDSSIVSIVSIPDMTFMANEVAVSSGRVFETWITASIAYFGLCFLLSTLFRRIEARGAAKLR